LVVLGFTVVFYLMKIFCSGTSLRTKDMGGFARGLELLIICSKDPGLWLIGMENVLHASLI